jgi:hypothetical protein
MEFEGRGPSHQGPGRRPALMAGALRGTQSASGVGVEGRVYEGPGRGGLKSRGRGSTAHPPDSLRAADAAYGRGIADRLWTQ